jgi:2-keto-4-pentenoate hydratase
MTNTAFDPNEVARHLIDAHARRVPFTNLPPALNPPSVEDAYAAQDALVRILGEREGRIAGLKIATTTKVMQQLMGIDHPCGGVIFERRVHASPARIRLADHMNVVIECEVGLRLKKDLLVAAAPFTAASVEAAVGAVMPAFELIEDRRADYKQTNALSVIAENCWNAGVVLGADVAFSPGRSLDRIAGKLAIDGRAAHEGLSDDPLSTLAWVANLAAHRGRALSAGMVVITGSVIPTLPIKAGETFVFSLDGLGSTELTAE